MKKIVSRIMLFILCSCFIFPITSFANSTGSEFAVVDETDILLESELNELNNILLSLRKKYSQDISVVIANELYRETAMESADDIFDYGGYGYGENSDGMLLYICLYPREYYFSTHGSAMKVFNRNGLVYLEEKVVPYLIDDDYYGAIKTYADTSEELLEMAAGGTPYNNRPIKDILIVISLVILIPFVIAFSLTFRKLKKMKTANKQEYASNYIKQGSFNITRQGDVFLYSTTTRTLKSKSISGGSHTSSSGRTHGGRGGSF